MPARAACWSLEHPSKAASAARQTVMPCDDRAISLRRLAGSSRRKILKRHKVLLDGCNPDFKASVGRGFEAVGAGLPTVGLKSCRSSKF